MGATLEGRGEFLPRRLRATASPVKTGTRTLSALSPTRSLPGRPPSDYADLKRIIRDAGLLRPQTSYYMLKTLVTAALLIAGVGAALLLSNPVLLLLDAAYLGFAATQIGLLSHDVGHRQAYRGTRTNAITRHLLGNVFLGISPSWWNDKHNQHHASPNHMDDDPDIQMPMLVFSEEQIARRPSWLRPVIAVQAFLFPVLLPFQAVNMRVQSLLFLRSGAARRPMLELALIALHFALYIALLVSLGSWPLALGFALVQQGVFGFYNSSVFASNHKGMAMVPPGEHWGFLREQVLTSRNVRAHPVIDFWYGGLNYQIEHHLFPTMPRNNLRRAQRIVVEFCAQRGIPYYQTGLLQSYREILAHLHAVSAPLRRGSAAAA